jgi:hypothetical protein
VHTLSDTGVNSETDWASRRLSLTNAGEIAAYVCRMAVEILDRVARTSPADKLGRPLTTSGGGNALASIKGGAAEASLAVRLPLAVVYSAATGSCGWGSSRTFEGRDYVSIRVRGGHE